MLNLLNRAVTRRAVCGLGGLILSGGTINQGVISVTSILVSLLGAVILLAIVNLVRRGSVR